MKSKDEVIVPSSCQEYSHIEETYCGSLYPLSHCVDTLTGQGPEENLSFLPSFFSRNVQPSKN